jgi:hypothetical protein
LSVEALGSPLAVACHDAGAANHIIAWLRGSPRLDVRACVDGPAASLWARAFPQWPGTALEEALQPSAALLSGTGWASRLEHDARALARGQGKRSIAVIDHWTDYRQRFVRGAELVLPDEIWVTDPYAKTLAEAAFPGLPVVEQPNLYLDEQARQVRSRGGPARPAAATHVLYVLEPIRHYSGANGQPGEFAALDFFFANLAVLGLGDAPIVRLRPHPSDAPGKYEAWLARQRAARVSMDPCAELAESLAWSEVVVGWQTSAMVVALAAGRRVVSSAPPGAPPCVLPHREVIRMSDLLPGGVLTENAPR